MDSTVQLAWGEESTPGGNLHLPSLSELLVSLGFHRMVAISATVEMKFCPSVRFVPEGVTKAGRESISSAGAEDSPFCNSHRTFMNGEGAITTRELAGNSWLYAQTEKWNRDFKFLICHTRLIGLLFRHPEAPWPTKVVAACTLGYVFSPIQIIPRFIPIIGQLDELAVVIVSMNLIRLLTPKSLVAECKCKADLTALRHATFPNR